MRLRSRAVDDGWYSRVGVRRFESYAVGFRQSEQRAPPEQSGGEGAKLRLFRLGEPWTKDVGVARMEHRHETVPISRTVRSTGHRCSSAAR